MTTDKETLIHIGLGSPEQVSQLATQIDTEVTAVGATVTALYVPSIQSAVEAVGTAIGTATDLTADICHVSHSEAGVNDGVQLRSPTTYKKEQIVINRGGANLKIYPHTSAAKIGGAAAGAAIVASNTQSVRFLAIADDEYEPTNL